MFLTAILRTMKIKDLSESERPREKMLQSGAAALSNGELIAILLRTGTSKMNAVQTAQTLLSLAGGKLSGLFALDMKSICSVPGIKTDKALTLISAMELGRRFLSEQPVARGKPIVSPRMVFDEMLPRLKAIRHEECWILLLNNAHCRIGRERIGVGDMRSTPVDMKNLLRIILDKKASAVIMVHNHPGSDPHPSSADIKLTDRLHQALETFGITLLDHVIITDSAFYSFADEKVYSA